MISIAMATYNGQKYLREQLDSILNQTISDFELVVSDDGSKDSTLEILKEYADKDSRIKIIHNDGEHGCPKNFENALRQCSGDYIAYSDQDDVWTPDHLEVLYNLLKESNSSLALGDAQAVDKDLKPLNFCWWEKFQITPERLENNILLHTLFLSFAQGTSSLFKRELLAAMPFENGIYHDHWAVISALMLNGISYTRKSLLKYRQHEANVMGVMNETFKDKIKGVFSNKKQRKNIYRSSVKIFEKLKPQISEEKQSEIKQTLNICKKINFNKNIFLLKKYYNVIFWDENKSKFLTRSILYCL